MRDRYISTLSEAAEYLPPEVKDRLIYLLLSMPEDLHAIHGDIHPNNIMISGKGNRVFDYGSLFVSIAAFNESYPENVKFLGLDADTDRKIYRGILHKSFGDYSSSLEDRIKTVGYMRMIYILAVRMSGAEKYRAGIENAVKNLAELCGQVESLAI